MFDVQYFVNEEKRTVVAKITGVADALICELCEKGYHGTPVILSQDEFVGKAKCSPDDIFDVEKGKKIAFKRAYYKYTRAKHVELKEFTNWVENYYNSLLNTVKGLSAKYEKAMEHRLKEIESIITE